MKKHIKYSVYSILGLGSLVSVWQGCSPNGFAVDTRQLASSASSGSNFVEDKTCTDSAVGEAPMQRLTKIEYNNVVRDLYGLNKDYSYDFSKNSEGTAGFTNEGEAQNLSLSVVTDYWKASQVVTDDVFAKNPNPLLASCNS
ncbi:MAG: DUF1587 domain-containing protein, partial [Proteobacteria bacterium]